MKSQQQASNDPAEPAPGTVLETIGESDFYSEEEVLRLKRLKGGIFKHFPKRKHPKLPLLERAFQDAEFHHRNQRRKSGEAFIFHPIRVALMVAEGGQDLESVIIALLHDVIEDTDITKEEIRSTYGDWLADVVDGLTKAAGGRKGRGGRDNTAQSMETYIKLISSTIKDLRTLQVKILDRLDNMRDLGYLSRTRQRTISGETLTVYAPMAERLGMQEIRDELTALCFRYLYPHRFKTYLGALKKAIQEETPRVNTLRRQLRKHMSPLKAIGLVVTPRYHQISDYIFSQTPLQNALAGFTIRARTGQDCYRALGEIHMQCRVVPNSIKDYISNPKPNRYQGLFSEVFLGGERLRLAFVSESMERVNRSGILAGWEGSNEDLERYYQSYLELLEHYSGNEDLRMEDVLRHAQMDTLQVFTPKGLPLTFPQGATVLDCAFAIHSDLGLHCAGAIMGGQPVGRFDILRDGEMVEILTDQNVTLNPTWLDHVHTSRAKLALRRHLNQQANQRAGEVGRELFSSLLERAGIDGKMLLASKEFQSTIKNQGVSTEQFFQRVGLRKISLPQFLGDMGLLELSAQKKMAGEEPSRILRYLKPMFRDPDPMLKIKSMDDGFFTLAECCAPLRGDPIIGVQEGPGIRIHRNACPLVGSVAASALFKVGWEPFNETIRCRLDVLLQNDRHGLLARISKVTADLKVNIEDITMLPARGNNGARIRLNLEPITFKTFRTVISKLRGIKEVDKVLLLSNTLPTAKR